MKRIIRNISGQLLSFAVTLAAIINGAVAHADCYAPPSGIVAWWPGEGNANDVIGGNNGTLVNGTDFTTNGEVASAFYFNGANNYVLVNPPTPSSLDVGQGSGLTIEGWINPTTVSQQQLITEYERTLGTDNGGDVGIDFAIQASTQLYADILETNQTGHEIYSPANVLVAGVWQHVAVTYDKASGLEELYINGAAVVQTNIGSFTPQTSFTNLLVGARTTYGSSSAPNTAFSGGIDELSFYNRALSSNEITGIYLAGSAGKCTPTPVAPVITQQPSNVTVQVGNSAAFSVTATGAAPLSYQWALNGTNIIGATNTTLTLANVQLSQAGGYSVLVSNIAGSTNSVFAVLTVQTPVTPTCDPAPSGIVAWWPGQSDAGDIIGGNNGTLVNGTGFTTNGEVNSAFYFNGANNYVLVNPLTPSSLDVGQGSGLTIEGWINPTTVTKQQLITEYERALGTANGGDVGIGLSIQGSTQLYANVTGTDNTSHEIYSPANVLVDGVWQHVAVTYDKASGLEELYINGAAVVQTNIGGFTPQTSFTNLLIGARTTYGSSSAPNTAFSGGIDELSFYNRALASNEIATIYLAGSAGKCTPTPVAPVIMQQPSNVTVQAGSSAAFSVTATGTAPLSYQWALNHTNIIGATNATLTLANVQVTQTGNYSVKVANNVGSVTSSNALLTVNAVAPTITSQPTNRTVVVGNSTTFTVTANGSQPLAYQWRFNSTNMLGATNAILTLANVQLSQAGNYSVRVINNYGSVISSNALLTVAQPPTISSQPAGQTVVVGNTATFTVTASGSQPLAYQWRFNNTNLLGATNAILRLANVQFSQAGNYSVKVTNNVGSITSSNAFLTVQTPVAPTCDSAPSGIVAWWPGQDNANDIVGNNTGTLINGTGFTTNGEVGSAFNFNGVNNLVIANPATPGSLDVGQGSGLTIEGWIRPANISSPSMIIAQYEGALGTANGANEGIVFVMDNIPNNGVHPGCLAGSLTDTAGQPHILGSANNVLSAGVWQHVALTYDKTSGMTALYANGIQVTNANLGVFTPQTSFTNLVFGGNTTYASVSSPADVFSGQMDEMSLYNRALASNEIAAIYSAGSAGKCTPTPVAPVITQEPTNETVQVGNSAAFSVTATGTAPLLYQWALNGTNIIGATNATLTLANVQLSQAGGYSVLVSNVAGSTNSVSAVLTVQTPTPPSCDPPPSGIVAWWPGQDNANDIVGNNTGTLINGASFTNGEVGSAFNFNGVNNLMIANPATPGSLDVGQGSGLTIEGWIRPANISSPSMIIAQYEGALGTANGANEGIVFVMDNIPNNGVHPGCLAGSLTDTAGQPHILGSANNVLSAGVWQHVALTYDKTSGMTALYVNGVQVTNANLGVFTPQTSFTNLVFGGNTTYASVSSPADVFSGQMDEMSLYNRALSSNEVAAIYSAGSAGKCTPAALAPVIMQQPTNVTVQVGNTAAFRVAATGTAPLLYQWALNGTNIIGATNATLTLANVQLSQAGGYSVLVSNIAGSTNSVAAVLTVNNVLPPFITTQPTSQTVTVGSTVTFSVGATSTAPLSYQWALNGTNIIGATNATLTLANVQLSQAGGYSVLVSNIAGSTNSVAAVLTVNTLPPAIVTQPSNETVQVGDSAAFSVTVTGTAPLSYQWALNGTNIIGATNATLTLANVQLSQAGGYSVLVSNIAGSTNSIAAVLTVQTPAPPSCDPPPSGIVAWWPGQDNANDIVGNNTGTLINGTGFTTNGEVGSAFNFNGVNNLMIANPATPGSLDVGQGSGLTIEGWIRPANISSPMMIIAQYEAVLGTANGANEGVVFVMDNIPNNGVHPGCLAGSLTDTAGQPHILGSAINVLTPGVWQHVALTYDKTSGMTALYANGIQVTNANLGVFTPQTSFTNLVFGGNTTYASVSSPADVFSGQMDEMSLYNRALASNEIAAIYSAGSAGKCSPPPAPSETVLTMVATNTISGSTITMPVFMNAVGTENTFLASVNYDPTKLVLQQVQLGTATAGAYLQEVDTQTNNGHVGFAILLNIGSTVPPGTQEVANVVFQTLPVTSNTTVNLTFGDSPTTRQVVDTNLNLLPAIYQGGSITLTPAEYEADVYPRTNGDHQVTVQDWLEVGRMVAGMDTPANSDEFHRADCAPRNAPDGVLTVADWVQAGRYALGLDPITLVTTPSSPAVVSLAGPLATSASGRILLIGSVSAQRGQIVSVPVQLVCTANENAAGMTIDYNPSQLILTGVSLGSALTGGRLNVNSNQSGEVGLVLALPPGGTLAPGTNQVAVLQFLSNTNASGTAALTFDSSVVTMQVADQLAESLPTTYINGAVTLPPQPFVAVTGAGANLQLSWPIASGSFQVQTSDSMLGPWTTIVLPIITNGANVYVTVPSTTNQQQYFRLQGQ